MAMTISKLRQLLNVRQGDVGETAINPAQLKTYLIRSERGRKRRAIRFIRKYQQSYRRDLLALRSGRSARARCLTLSPGISGNLYSSGREVSRTRSSLCHHGGCFTSPALFTVLSRCSSYRCFSKLHHRPHPPRVTTVRGAATAQ